MLFRVSSPVSIHPKRVGIVFTGTAIKWWYEGFKKSGEFILIDCYNSDSWYIRGKYEKKRLIVKLQVIVLQLKSNTYVKVN